MTKKISYTNEPLGDVEVIRDFLPPPSELAFSEEGGESHTGFEQEQRRFFQNRLFTTRNAS